MTDQTNVTPIAGSNSGITFDSFKKEVVGFARAFAKGLMSREALGIRAVEAAAKSPEINQVAGPLLYMEWKKAEWEAKKYPGEYAAEKSFTQQASKFTSFIKVGMLTEVDGVDYINRAYSVVKELHASGVLAESPYDSLVWCCRYQLDDKNKTLPLQVRNPRPSWKRW